jgi:hypothetical protein
LKLLFIGFAAIARSLIDERYFSGMNHATRFKDSGPRKSARGGESVWDIRLVADEVEFILKATPPPIFSVPRGPHCTSRAFNR